MIKLSGSELFAATDNRDHLRFALPKCQTVIPYRNHDWIAEWCGPDDADRRAGNNSHLHQPPGNRAAAADRDDPCRHSVRNRIKRGRRGISKTHN